MRKELLLLLLAGCSAATGDEVAMESAGISPGCQPSSTACAAFSFSPDALAHATWRGYECPAGVQPTAESFAVDSGGGELFACTGVWIGAYSPSAPWNWCCPSAK
jgi:hypothetical protein